MPKILFTALHRPDRSPSQRFRFEQYISFLEKHGFQCEYSWLIDEKTDQFFYKPGSYFKKFLVLVKSFYKRWKEGLRANEYDIIFVQREALMTKAYFFEKMVAKSKAKLVFDFDDSIWLQNVSDANKKLSFLKDPDKTKKIIALADLVIPGNEFLADYARRFNENVTIIPTTIDTDEYQRIEKGTTKKICIGWSGSFSTIEHFKHAIPALEAVKNKYGKAISIKVIGDGNYHNAPLDIHGIPWTKKEEVKELSEIDIGIMPLKDTEWEKGKCGLKGLQYMALGIPTIMSPVGVNKDIIQDGENGLLAYTIEEWIDKLSYLIENEKARKTIGAYGRETVLKDYSVHANASKYLNTFNALLG